MGSRLMTDYLSEIKAKVDLNIASRLPIPVEYVIYYTLNELPATFNSFKTSIQTNLQAISLDNLYSLICSEAELISQEIAKTNPDSVLALTLYPSSGRGRSNYSYLGRGRQFVGQGHGRSSNNITCKFVTKLGTLHLIIGIERTSNTPIRLDPRILLLHHKLTQLFQPKGGGFLTLGYPLTYQTTRLLFTTLPLTMLMNTLLLEMVNPFQSLIRDKVYYLHLPVN